MTDGHDAADDHEPTDTPTESDAPDTVDTRAGDVPVGGPNDTRPIREREAAWPVIETGELLSTPYFTAGYDDVRRSDGEARYYWIEPGDAVAVVAHDRTTDELVMVEQYRPKLRREFCEVPGGGVDGDESPREAARRELREETGYRAGRVERLGAYHPTGYARMTRHVCYATDLSPGEPDLDDGEQLRVTRRDPDRVLRDAEDSVATGWTVTPLLWATRAGLL